MQTWKQASIVRPTPVRVYIVAEWIRNNIVPPFTHKYYCALPLKSLVSLHSVHKHDVIYKSIFDEYIFSYNHVSVIYSHFLVYCSLYTVEITLIALRWKICREMTNWRTRNFILELPEIRFSQFVRNSFVNGIHWKLRNVMNVMKLQRRLKWAEKTKMNEWMNGK